MRVVEPVSLTLGAITAALMAKAADTAAERMVDSGAGALGRALGRLRKRLGADESQDGVRALARVENAPDSPSRVQDLAQVLDRRADADADFRSELEGLVQEAQAGGVDVGSITQAVWGNQNVQVAGTVGSDVTVTYGQPPATPER